MKFLLQLGPINFIFSNLLLQFTLDFIDAISAEFRFLVVQLRALIFFMWEIIFYIKKTLAEQELNF
jgi:hypothetical protein